MQNSVLNVESRVSDAKKIKKNLYGKPQTILAVFTAGMGETALNEVQFILNNLWFKQKFTSEFSLSKNVIRIDQIHLFAMTELLMRSQSLSDIRLVIFEGSASSKEMFRKKCMGIHWHFFLNKNMTLKIKVNSVASRAFHETGLKEILGDIVNEYVDSLVSGENTGETTILYADLYQNRLTISLSLAGEPLYKRGYRHVLSASAPLREDAAFCCLDKALHFVKKIDPDYLPETVFIPFSGTGTFAFEYLQSRFKFSPVLFFREYAFVKMPFFNPENFNFLLKKARENFLKADDDIHFICIDHSKNAISSFIENMKNVKNTFLEQEFSVTEKMIEYGEEDFFEMDFRKKITGRHVFMPLNPPYGIRMGRNSHSEDLYKKIANRVNEVAQITQKAGKKLLGFILCPDEKSWSLFCNTIKNVKMETWHFMQGGLDIRVCQFFL